jgi:hypothetical protein
MPDEVKVESFELEGCGLIEAKSPDEAIKIFQDNTTFKPVTDNGTPMPFEILRTYWCESDMPLEPLKEGDYCIHITFKVNGDIEDFDMENSKLSLFDDNERSFDIY